MCLASGQVFSTSTRVNREVHMLVEKKKVDKIRKWIPFAFFSELKAIFQIRPSVPTCTVVRRKGAFDSLQTEGILIFCVINRVS